MQGRRKVSKPAGKRSCAVFLEALIVQTVEYASVSILEPMKVRFAW